MRLILLVCCLLLTFGAASASPETVALPADTVRQNWENRSVLPWTDDGASRLIKYFDVRADETVALSFAPDSRKHRACIGVYDREGRFLWGLSYGTRNAVPVEWSEGGLLLHFTDYTAAVDAAGNCLGMTAFASAAEGNQHIRSLSEPSREIGSMRYILRLATPLASGYSTVARVTPDGTEELPPIYDRPAVGVGSTLLTSGVLAFVGVVAFLLMRKNVQKHT